MRQHKSQQKTRHNARSPGLERDFPTFQYLAESGQGAGKDPEPAGWKSLRYESRVLRGFGLWTLDFGLRALAPSRRARNGCSGPCKDDYEDAQHEVIPARCWIVSVIQQKRGNDQPNVPHTAMPAPVLLLGTHHQ